jgi:hypothetical protein
VDARALPFLDGHVVPELARFEVLGRPLSAVANGVLRAPAVRCTYIATVACSEELEVEAWARARLELDMHVDELADLDVEFASLDRVDRDGVVALWLDDAVRAAWDAAAEVDDRPLELHVRAGTCVLVGRVGVADRAGMERVVAVVGALAAAPERRAADLVAGLAGALRAPGPPRLRLDAAGPVAATSGIEVEVSVCLAPGPDCAARAVRTVLRASATDAAPLVVVDPALARGRRPDRHGRLVEAGGWLADGPVPAALHAALDRARPSALVVAADAIRVALPAAADARQLDAALGVIATAVGDARRSPYR